MKRSTYLSLYIAFCMFLTTLAYSDAAMAVDAGDLAVIAFSSDNPDALSFVVMNEIPAGTTIRFTDSGWQSSGGFRANEGGIEYVVSTALSPGTVITRANPFAGGDWSADGDGVGGGAFSLSTSGDQILAFVGSAASPSFIHAIDFDSTDFGNASSSNTTGLPPGLTVGVSAVDLGETDNGYYSGPTSGSVASLLAAIGNPSNWTLSDTLQSPPGWSFVVDSNVGSTLQGVSITGTSFLTGEMTTISVDLSEAPAMGDPAFIQLTSGAFVSPYNLSISHPDTNGLVDVTLANNGTWTIDATASGGASGFATTTGFVVGSLANPPTAFAGSDRIVELAPNDVSVSLSGAMGDDPDGLAGASYAWTPVSGAGIVGWSGRTGVMSATTSPGGASVTFDSAGVYQLVLTITDTTGLMASDNLQVTVSDPIPTDDFDPPAGYYDSATGQGSTLLTQLSSILSSGHNQQTYGDFRDNSSYYDEDPNVPGNILLVYNRASVSGTWDSGSTWNREHVWPQSRQPGSASNGSTGNLGDPHALRPSAPGINSSRGNDPFGTFASSGSYGPEGSEWFPGEFDKGDIARSLFYSATRYMSTHTLVSGTPSGNQMGDLDALLRWHYTDVPDFFERRRNHRVYDVQGNRSAYVDRPEWVWSVFGDGANDSTIYVTDTLPADGSSSISIAHPGVIVGGPLPGSTSVLIRKAGSDPTYYSVNALGDATASVHGRFNAFEYGSQLTLMDVGLTGTTTAPGPLSGSIVIDNLDITNQGAGTGSIDGNDIVAVSMDVLDHSEASFSAVTNDDALLVDFGSVSSLDGIQLMSFEIHNLEATIGFTADLALVSVISTGDDDVFGTDASPFGNLSAGANVQLTATFDPSALGVGGYAATYTFSVSDENLQGGVSGAPLVLMLTASVDGNNDEDGDGVLDASDICPGTLPGVLVDCVGRPQRDADNDCVLTPLDIAGIVNELIGQTDSVPMVDDADGDGVSDVSDQCAGTANGLAVDCIGRPLRDADGDCRVDGRDISLIVSELIGL